MSDRTYKDVRKELLQHYKGKEYTLAFALLEQEQANFPADAQEITYWQIALNALLDRPDEALRVLRASLDKGIWFPPAWMEQDDDMISLRPLPEFQALVEECRQHLARIQEGVRPDLLVRQPAEQATALPLLIAMHGNGNNMHSTVDHWSDITTQGWLLAVPQSSQIVGPDAFVWDERAKSTAEVREHLVALNKEYTIDPTRVILGGFSMGGGQAIWMAVQQAVKTGGFAVLGPYLRDEELEQLPSLLEMHKPTGLRGAILVGEEDTGCLAVSRKVVEIMRAHDLPCELEVRPGLDHSYPDDFAAWVSTALTSVTQS